MKVSTPGRVFTKTIALSAPMTNKPVDNASASAASVETTVTLFVPRAGYPV